MKGELVRETFQLEVEAKRRLKKAKELRSNKNLPSKNSSNNNNSNRGFGKKALNRSIGGQGQGTNEVAWLDFVSLLNTLERFGCVAKEECRPGEDEPNESQYCTTEKGELVGRVNSDNPLHFAAALGLVWDVTDEGRTAKAAELRSLLSEMTVEEISGFVSCLSPRNDGRSGLGGEYVELELSDSADLALSMVCDISEGLAKAQVAMGCDCDENPVQIDPTSYAAVSDWVGGCDWSTLTSRSLMDQGDLAQTLLRAADLVRQAGEASSDIRKKCEEGRRRIMREPLVDEFGNMLL